MTRMDWKRAIERWRSRTLEERTRARRARLPLNVAESMAFEGEPVELAALRAEHARLVAQSAASKPGATS